MNFERAGMQGRHPHRGLACAESRLLHRRRLSPTLRTFEERVESEPEAGNHNEPVVAYEDVFLVPGRAGLQP